MTRKLAKLLRLVTRPLFWRAGFRGVAAGIEHHPVLSSLAWRTVVDIGANRGQFALVCRDLMPSAEVHAFEPLASAFEVLARVFAKDPLAKLYHSAIGSEAAVATMHVSRREDSSSLLPIGAAQSAYFPGTAESHTVEVRVAPLDAFLSATQIIAPALLKIDVQGYELTVLRGCESLIGSFSNVYVECSFVELYRGQALAVDVISYLEARGFGLIGVYNVRYDAAGLAIQADFLFRSRF